jgi:hypothetical protein
VREDVQVKSTHNEWMLHRALAGDSLYERERARLLSSLGEDEELLDVVTAGAGFVRPGVLAVTTERVLHVYFRRLWFRGFAVVSVPYSRIQRVYPQRGFRGYETVVLNLVRPRRSLSFSPFGGQDEVERIAQTISKEVARYRYRAGIDG